MAKGDETPFDLYVKFFGVVKSGTMVTDRDYVQSVAGSGVKFSTEERLAASLAIDDVKTSQQLRTQSEFKKEIARLMA